MRISTFILPVVAVSTLAGCTGSTLTIGPGKTLAQFAAEHDALETTVDDVFLNEGTTAFADLPDTAGADTAS